MAETNLPGRLVEIESMLDRSRRRFEEGTRLVEEAHKILADVQQAIDALFGGPAPRSPGETSLLDAAGRNDAQLGIRSQLWDPDTRIVDKGPTTVQILSAAATSTNIASAQAGQ